MISISPQPFSSNEKLIVFKTPNGNRLLAKFNKNTDTVGDAIHTVKNIIKFSLQASGSEEPYQLKHLKYKINNETLLDKISNDLICELQIVSDSAARDIDIRHNIEYSDDIYDAKLNRDKLASIYKSKKRQLLRTWASNNKTLGIHGNSKSTDILSAIDERYLKSKQVFIKTLTGKTITLKLNNDYFVLELMNAITEKEGIPYIQQILVHGGKQLEPLRKLFDYVGGDIDEQTLHLVLRLRGGMYDEKSGRNGQYLPISSILNKLFTIQKVNVSDDIEINELVELISSPSC